MHDASPREFRLTNASVYDEIIDGIFYPFDIRISTTDI